MQPPTNSLQNQILRLEALLSSNQEPQTTPPAYSPTNPMAPVLYEDQSLDEEDYDYPASRPAPITINIDVSLRIEGQANTVVLPPASSPVSSPSSSTKPSPAAMTSQPSYQHGRVEKVTSMVLTALKEAKIFRSTQATDGQTTTRPVEISVNAGIVLKGSKNTICSGLPKLMKGNGAPAAAAAAAAAARDKANLKMGEDGVAAESRKRRACSEPSETSTAKKPRLP